MLAATYTQGGKFGIEDVPVPAIGNGEMLLRVRAAAICGTDIKIVQNGHRKLKDGQKIVLGHEFVGQIAEIGGEVAGYRKEQRVGVLPNAGCGVCDACLRGEANYCPDYTALGIDMNGVHAPLVRIPAKFIAQGNVMPLPESIPDKDASLLEPFSCVVNGVRVSRIELGDTVLIYGAGPIGLMHVMLCRISGAARLVVADPLEDRLERARALGADATINPRNESVKERVMAETQGRGVDVAITACPVPAVQEEAPDLLAPFGRLCLFGGLRRGSSKIQFDSNAVHYRNLTVTGSTGGSARDFKAAMRLVAGARVDLSRVISDVFSLSDLAAAYEKAGSSPSGKVVLMG